MGNLIYIVGIGPGEEAGMTAQARAALEQSDVIIGYTLYVKLVEKNFPGKEFMTTGMRQEIERCRLCFEKAGEGKSVALICS